MYKRGFAASLLALTLSIPAGATIISGTVTGGTAFTAGGVFVKLTVPLANPFGTPNSVGNDTFQSPNLFGFDEDQNILLAAPLVVDVGSSPIPAGNHGGEPLYLLRSRPDPARNRNSEFRFRRSRHHYQHGKSRGE